METPIAISVTAVLVAVIIMATALAGPRVGLGLGRVPEVLSEQAVFSEPAELAPELVNALSGRRVILLGETHYVQEHHEFLGSFFRATHAQGLRYFVQEMSHASGWAVDDYVRGLRSDYPDSVKPLDAYWIGALREFNTGLVPEERIRVRYNDMNHNELAFRISLQMMSRETALAASVAGAAVKAVLAADPTTAADSIPADSIPADPWYEPALHELGRVIEQNGARLRSEIGTEWYERLSGTLAVELRTLPLRDNWDVATRERLMIDLTVKVMQEAGTDRSDGATVAVNTGMFHAQRRRYMGTRQQWLGEYLAANPELYGGPEGLYSLAVFGFTGEMLRRFTDREARQVPHPTTRSQYTLSRRLYEQSPPGKMVFLPLQDPVFERRMRLAFSYSELTGRPGRQFDAYLVHPQISVLESLRARW